MPRSVSRAPRLEPDQVVHVSLRLMDEVGLDGLSLRPLADRLDVKAQALYWHFRNKQELLDHMAHAMTRPWMEEVRAGGQGQGWREWLGHTARRYRALLLSHRDGARLVASTRPLPDSFPLMDACILAFQQATGCGPGEALQCLTTITAFVRGFVLDEQARHPRGPNELAADPQDPLRRTLRAESEDTSRFPPESAPHLAAALSGIGSPDGEETFEFGLALIIEGIGRTVIR